MKTNIQKFEVQFLDRKDLKNAPYNPRKINKTNKEALGKAINELGLLEPLVWNKRTGNLVSGHQRLAIIDSQTGHSDYQLDVAVVDLSEKDEAKANIALNNRSLQGDFNFLKLKDMAISFDLDLSDDILKINNFDIDSDIVYSGGTYACRDTEANIEEESRDIIVIYPDVETKEKFEAYKSNKKIKNDTEAFKCLIHTLANF